MNPRKLIVTGLGTGYLPVSGTWGSLVTVAIYLLVSWACQGGGQPLQLGAWPVQLTMLAVAILASWACVGWGDYVEATWEKDPSHCTIDEVAGQAVALLAMPSAADPRSWFVVAGVCFVLFRVMDIVKPPPARQFEKLPKGWGVLTDDLMAGVYANITAQLIIRLVLI